MSDVDSTAEGIDQLAKVERIKGGAIRRSNIKNILLIQLGDLGDVIVTIPCLRALKENFPKASLTIAVYHKAKELLYECPWIDDVLIVDPPADGQFKRMCNYLKFARDVRCMRYELVFDLRTGDRGAILTLLTGAAQRVSFYGKYNTLWRNRIYSHLVYPDISPDVHIVDYYLSLLNAYGIDTTVRTPTFEITGNQIQETTQLLQREGVEPLDRLIAYHPFSLWQYKGWAEEKHIRIINWIVLRFNVGILITGTAGQKQWAEAIVQRCDKGVYNFAGKTSLDQMPALLRCCKASMGVDTAGGHIAAAVGTPTITIFGPGNFMQWAPKAKRGLIVHKEWDCVPCRRMGCDGSGKSKCLDELSVEEVKSAIETFIEESLKTDRHID